MRPSPILRACSLGVVLLLGACFDPDPTPIETESVGSTDGSTTMGGTACEPGDVQDCVCANDLAGMQICSADGSGFGACDCEAADDTSTTGDPSTSSSTDVTTGPPPECTDDADCESMAEGECEQGVCTPDGTCEVQFLAEGTACGDDAETECSAADTCDARGQCVANDALDGTACSECDLGVCTCAAGACGDCATFAPQNNFITTRSIAGWTLTGGWGLYRAAPQNQLQGPTTFGSQVFGTDGNRVAPYPGGETEVSSARSGLVTLPATLEFLSWNVDEGSGFDTKVIRVSTDGGATFTTVFDCNAGGGQPFCQFRQAPRAPDDWDAISIPLPPALVGVTGIVELTYDTGDSCCSFEQGWFIDVTNFATECACADDGACEGLGSDCGAAVCGGTGECELDAVAAGMACGDATDVECNDPDACDGIGYCAPNVAATGLTECNDCPAGPGSCNACQEGACVDCQTLTTTDFNGGLPPGWLVENLGAGTADWQIFNNAPPNQEAGSVPLPLSFAPSFGTDGNRQAPYPGGESEHSRVTTAPGEVPAVLEFSSWNVDEGSGFDTKTVEISVDGGVTWNVLVSCSGGINVQPFCDFRDATRLGDDWDAIALDTASFAGQQGQLRFTYNTGDGCCGFEKGWFIDNLNLGQVCLDSPFP